MKAFTDISQSKKLAKILPLESADMYYFTIIRDYPYSQGKIKTIAKIMDGSFSSDYDTPCWSLAALFIVIRKSVGYELLCNGTSITIKCELGDNPWSIEINKDNELDACIEAIVKLHELNLL